MPGLFFVPLWPESSFFFVNRLLLLSCLIFIFCVHPFYSKVQRAGCTLSSSLSLRHAGRFLFKCSRRSGYRPSTAFSFISSQHGSPHSNIWYRAMDRAGGPTYQLGTCSHRQANTHTETWRQACTCSHRKRGGSM